jgi:hypothetical protein
MVKERLAVAKRLFEQFDVGSNQQLGNSGNDNNQHNQHISNKREIKSSYQESLSPKKDEERDQRKRNGIEEERTS